MPSKSISHSDLLELIHYNPRTGVITWLKDIGKRIKRGNVAGSKDSYGYIQIGGLGPTKKAHRIAWFYFYGRWPNGMLDHRNQIKDDNRIRNLKEATHVSNGRNCKMSSRNTSGFIGVTWSRGKWQGQIQVKGRSMHLGRFNTAEEAAKARKKAEKLYGFHPNHGKNI